MKIFIVIPLFNEEKHISLVLKGVSKFNLPIVVVDDGSKDKSIIKVKESGIKNLILLQHKVNLGKGAAMKTGAEYAFSNKADAIIFMDADAQHNSDDLPKFINVLQENKYDIVFGSRNLGMGVPLIRFLGNKFASILIQFLFGTYITDLICGYKGITKKGYSFVKWDSSGYGVETEIAVRTAKSKIKYCEIPVDTIYHDNVKGVTILDAFGILTEVVKWKLVLK